MISTDYIVEAGELIPKAIGGERGNSKGEKYFCFNEIEYSLSRIVYGTFEFK